MGCAFIFEEWPEGSMAIRSDDLAQVRDIATGMGSSRKRRTLRSSAACLVALSLLLLGLVTTRASAEGLDENQLKAAYLFNFARYVEWPKESHDSKGSSLEIGVVGGGAVSELLLNTVSGKKVGNRQLHGVDVRSHTDDRSSHILFIPGKFGADEQKQVVKDMEGTHVFVVADAAKFAERAGIANFIVSGSRLKFAINKRAAKNAGLKVNSKRLRLAELAD